MEVFQKGHIRDSMCRLEGAQRSTLCFSGYQRIPGAAVPLPRLDAPRIQPGVLKSDATMIFMSRITFSIALFLHLRS